MSIKRITLGELQAMAEEACGCIDHIYLHWTAGHYHQFYNDYHLNIDVDGAIMCTGDLTEVKAHTWRRNTNAIGIAMCCCADARAFAGGKVVFGTEPPTPEQIDSMAKVVAVLCKGLDLAINKHNVMTHCEIAEIDDYGPSTTCERWDLWKLPNVPGDGDIMEGGDVIRGKAIWWQNH